MIYAELSMTTQSPTSSPTKSPIWLGYMFGALGSAFFATKGTVIKLALIENVDVTTMLAWRMLIALPIFVIVGTLAYRERKAKNPNFKLSATMLAKICLVGAIGYYAASYLDFMGLQYISVQLDRLIMLTYPFIVVLIGAVIFKRRVTRAMIVGLLISYAGLAIIFARDMTLGASASSNIPLGVALVFGASLSYAIYQLAAKPLIDEIGARLFTSIAMSAAGFLVIGQFLLTHEVADIIVSQRAAWMMLALGTVSTVLPTYMISASIGMVGSAPTAMLSNVSPLVSIGLAVTVLGEIFTVYHAIGAALVLLGVLGFSRSEYKAARQIIPKSPPPV